MHVFVFKRTCCCYVLVDVCVLWMCVCVVDVCCGCVCVSCCGCVGVADVCMCVVAMCLWMCVCMTCA